MVYRKLYEPGLKVPYLFSRVDIPLRSSVKGASFKYDPGLYPVGATPPFDPGLSASPNTGSVLNE